MIAPRILPRTQTPYRVLKLTGPTFWEKIVYDVNTRGFHVIQFVQWSVWVVGF